MHGVFHGEGHDDHVAFGALEAFDGVDGDRLVMGGQFLPDGGDLGAEGGDDAHGGGGVEAFAVELVYVGDEFGGQGGFFFVHFGARVAAGGEEGHAPGEEGVQGVVAVGPGDGGVLFGQGGFEPAAIEVFIGVGGDVGVHAVVVFEHAVAVVPAAAAGVGQQAGEE